MKLSIALSLLILAAAAGLGWHDRQRLVSVRASHTQLVLEASQLGIALDPRNPAESPRVTKRGRENREADARLAAAEFIAFAKEMEAKEKKGGPPHEATQKKMLDFMDRMMSLDSAQLKILIAEVRANKDLKDETRQGLIGFSIMTLASDHPKAALAIFTESADLFEGRGMGTHVVSSALSNWAKEDPQGALDWVKANGPKFPDLVTDEAKRGLISGAAAQDPRLAFKLIGELGIKEPGNSVARIVEAARTPEERTATLVALRAHLATLTDEKARNETTDNAMRTLAHGIAEQESFESASHWIAGAKLSPEELQNFADGLSYSTTTGKQGQWIEWVGQTLPAGKSDGSIRNLVHIWTENDYQAAGKWLATTPDGPAKNTSVRTYAETVSKYEPETAAQWAMTLPPGKDRDETLKQIHRNWPKDDQAAKETFAREHGIK